MAILTPSSALSNFANKTIDASAAIQWRHDQFPRVDGVTHGVYSMGGVLDLPAGVLTIGKSLSLYSGMRLRGQGTRTVLKYTGSDAAILMDGVNHCYASVESMQICSDTGGGIRYSDDMVFGKGDVLRDLWITTKGQAISLRHKLGDGVIYNPTVERIEFLNLGSGALDARTTNGRIAQLMLTHEPRAGFTPPTCGAMLSFEGRAVVESLVAEHNSDVPLIRFASAGDGPGNFAAAGIHLEPNARTDGQVIPSMIVDNSYLNHAGVVFFGTATNPITIINGSRVTTSKAQGDGTDLSVRVDNTSTLDQTAGA